MLSQKKVTGSELGRHGWPDISIRILNCTLIFIFIIFSRHFYPVLMKKLTAQAIRHIKDNNPKDATAEVYVHNS